LSNRQAYYDPNKMALFHRQGVIDQRKKCLSLHETWGWHGCSVDVASDILQNGFITEFNLASQYGRGTYFAKFCRYPLCASSSGIDLHPRYTPPKMGASRLQRRTLILSRLLLGEPSLGTSGQCAPDPSSLFEAGLKTSKLSDSMCGFEMAPDNQVDLRVQDATIYVVGVGPQTFPEFLVTLKEVK
jgi:hypothetical protein